MSVINKNQLLEAGVHFGHNTRRWNPKMKEYIFGERNGIYIIDLEKTVAKIEEAYKELFTIVQNNGTVMFVGTRKQTQDVIKEEAIRCGSFYVDQRWLGGTLTNFKTIRKSIARLYEIEKMEEDGTFEVLPKKEVILIRKEKERLDKYFGGIKEMKGAPQALVVVDPKTEHNAVAEAHRLNIPVFGLVDTNCDPDEVDYVIPANDDAIRSVKLIVATLANAVVEAQGGTPIVIEFTDEPLPEERPRRQPNERNQRGGRGGQRPYRKENKPAEGEAKAEEAAPQKEKPQRAPRKLRGEEAEAPVAEEAKVEEAPQEEAPKPKKTRAKKAEAPVEEAKAEEAPVEEKPKKTRAKKAEAAEEKVAEEAPKAKKTTKAKKEAEEKVEEAEVEKPKRGRKPKAEAAEEAK